MCKQIICLSFGKGRRHDFKLFKASGVRLPPAAENLQDKGYQCIQKIYAKILLPHKKSLFEGLPHFGGTLSQSVQTFWPALQSVGRDLQLGKSAG